MTDEGAPQLLVETETVQASESQRLASKMSSGKIPDDSALFDSTSNGLLDEKIPTRSVKSQYQPLKMPSTTASNTADSNNDTTGSSKHDTVPPQKTKNGGKSDLLVTSIPSSEIKQMVKSNSRQSKDESVLMPAPMHHAKIVMTDNNPTSSMPPPTITTPTSAIGKELTAKASKIMERPSMPAMNSREILLENESKPAKPPLSINRSQEDQSLEADAGSLHFPSKTDFFAARLASAVGENEISDSEETFVYESAANSSKNVPPGRLPEISQKHSIDNSLSDYNIDSFKSNGVSSKASVPVLNSNTKLLHRLKSTRHTSMGALPNGPTKTIVPRLQNSVKKSSGHGAPVGSSFNGYSLQDEGVSSPRAKSRYVDNQAIDAYGSDLVSSHKPSFASLVPSTPGSPDRSERDLQHNRNWNTMRSAVSSSTLRRSSGVGSETRKLVNSKESKKGMRGFAPDALDRDAIPLRRYSGAPDGATLDDYGYPSASYPQNAMFTSKGTDTIQEEPSDFSIGGHHEERGDDTSLFYYKHRSDLTDRPQISSYDDGDEYDEEPDQVGNVDNTTLGEFNNLHHQYSFQSVVNDQNTDKHGEYYTVSHHNNMHNNKPYLRPFIENPTETTPLRARKQYLLNEASYSPHNFYTKKSSWGRVKNCIYVSFLMVSLITVGFVLGFLLATNKELQGFDIVIMDNVLSSSDELVFDITVSAFNPGLFTIFVDQTDMDIFAKTKYLKHDPFSGQPVAETFLLGTIEQLETPLRFQGGFFTRHYDVSQASIKLLNPGDTNSKHDDNSNRGGELSNDQSSWQRLRHHEYELVIRGSLKYKIPVFRSQNSISVEKSTDVHPDDNDDNTGM